MTGEVVSGGTVSLHGLHMGEHGALLHANIRHHLRRAIIICYSSRITMLLGHTGICVCVCVCVCVIYLLAVLGLHCFTGFSLVVVSDGTF